MTLYFLYDVVNDPESTYVIFASLKRETIGITGK